MEASRNCRLRRRTGKANIGIESHSKGPVDDAADGSGSGFIRRGGVLAVRRSMECGVPPPPLKTTTAMAMTVATTGGCRVPLTRHGVLLLCVLLLQLLLGLGVAPVAARPPVENGADEQTTHPRRHGHGHGHGDGDGEGEGREGGGLLDGTVRLVGGQMAGTGNVLVYHQGRWGAVCDDGWTLEAAHIVCKVLGHPYALGYTNQAYFGKPEHSIELDDVRCYGDETSILDCVHADWGHHDCDKSEAAGVFCTPKSIVRQTTPQPPTDPPTTTPTTTMTTTTTTTKRPTTPIKKRKLKNKNEGFSFMQDARETGRKEEEDTRETRRREEEEEEDARETRRREEEEEEERELVEMEPEVASDIGPEVTGEGEPARLTAHDEREIVPLPEVNETGTLHSNATDAVFTKVLEKKKAVIQKGIDADKTKVKEFVKATVNEVESKAYDNPHMPPPYSIRVVNGRSEKEGRVEIRLGGVWGLVCSDNWSLLEARVACRQAGLGHAKMAARGTYFGGESMPKLVAGLRCDGLEARLSDCYHEQVGDVTCPEVQYISGVVCTWALPDLVPNNTVLETSTYLQDQPMSYLQCAMEEGCASASAYELKKKHYNWAEQRRRLLRFTSTTWNYGTSDFRPFIPKNAWEWHMCHMHYHSMEVFAVYDLLDMNHNRVAEGHKASFCLEDVECLPGKAKLFECTGFNDQGISAGCADIYLHSIDCQWIDITDVSPGKYFFRVHINPEFKVAELDYSNNAATCDLVYNGYNVVVTNCAVGDGSHMPHRPEVDSSLE